jgi:geranylgeranyl diphosphate synthase type I
MPLSLSPSFRDRLDVYKQAIEADIAAYASDVRANTVKQYGSYVAEVETDIFLDMLQRGGKRIRGALTMVGYEMAGGTNKPMIIQAARAIEMLHAYILMIDDIQDRSKLRRGKPTAHELLAAYHTRNNLKGDAAHAGMSLALMSAIAGGHAAQVVLANLDVDPDARLKALSISNRTMVVTAHGQTLDIMNELVANPSTADVERVLEWKTALYTIINPLQVGMVLGCASCEYTDAITPYGLHTGKAFQITDDILGIYGDEAILGKTSGDDIREGKGTLLVLYALEHANPQDRQVLQACLGKQDLSDDDLVRCRHIIKSSGALEHARHQAREHTKAALASLEASKGLWTKEGTSFLRSLTLALQDRVQ